MLQIAGTDTDRVRSVLGITFKDMTDDQMVIRDLEKELILDVSSWVSNLEALKEIVNMGTATAEEVNVLDAIGLYSTYFCARLVIPSLQLGAAHSISDGKNAMDRFASINWDQLYDRISERVKFYKQYVQDNNVIVGGTSTTSVYKPFALVSSSYNPVTNA